MQCCLCAVVFCRIKAGLFVGGLTKHKMADASCEEPITAGESIKFDGSVCIICNCVWLAYFSSHASDVSRITYTVLVETLNPAQSSSL